jgi:peptidoglycan hydrolase-like protein with peptidoglycan-binding domain
MMHRVSYGLMVILITLVFVMPFVASADRQSEILKEITEIFEQIKLLQAQLDALATNPTTPTYTTPPSTTAPPYSDGFCPVISRNLGIGSEGADVTELQRYLAQDGSVYPEGIVSGYFGTLSQVAVQRWQVKYGIVSSGTPNTTGYGVVGPKTRNAIRNCGDSVPSSFGALMQISPSSGEEPLIVNAKITVNTSKSCSRATYNLDFGDGSVPTKIVVPENRCQEMVQNIGHTYNSAGSYSVTLGVGSNRTSLPVTVRKISDLNEPFVSPTSGMSPLLVQAQATFKTQSCSSLPHEFQTFRVNFGDGTIEDVYIYNASTVPSDCGKTLTKSISHRYTKNGIYTIILEEIGPDNSGASSLVNSSTIGTVNVSPESSSDVGSGVIIGTFSVSPVTGSVPHTVSASFSHGVCRDAESWRLDWGDGIRNEETLIRSDSSTVSCSALLANRVFTHTFGQVGTFYIRFYKGGGDVNTAPLIATRTVVVSQ